MRSPLLPSVAALCALGLITGCKPASQTAFEPFVKTGGYVDAGRPACAARYRAFLDYAKSHGSGRGYETLQATELGHGNASTVWAKVAVYPVAGEDRLYVFTLPGHPAHPAVLIKSTYVNSEGMHQVVNGCAWGEQEAFTRFLTAAQVSAAWFQKEIRQGPMPGDVVPQSQRDPGEVRVAKADDLVAKVAERAWLMNRAGQPPSTIYAKTGADPLMAAATFIWLETPSPSADRDTLVDAAVIDFHTDDGAKALASWCGGANGGRTPQLCKRAKQRAAEWALIKSM